LIAVPVIGYLKNPGSTDKTPLIAAFHYVNIFNKIKVFS